MKIIQDPPADGPANMQRDLDLLESMQDQPILRLYKWSGNWASYGYFQTEAEAQAHFFKEELQFVKRPTGGGLVDHRHDLTYTLLIPKAHPLAKVSRRESYLHIHKIVHRALAATGVENILVSKESGQSPACFEHPVPGDIINPNTGKKIAGAAQRRTRHGLLHQGSILTSCLNSKNLTSYFLKEFTQGS